MSDENLYEVSPSDGLNLYLTERSDELREQTITTLRYRVGMFIDWCDEYNIDSLNQLDGMDLHRYRLRAAEGVGKRLSPADFPPYGLFFGGLHRWRRSIPTFPSASTYPG